MQFGTFSPIFRFHSTKNPYHEHRPWGHGTEVLRITREAMQLRHALIPYVYTMAWRNHTQSIPLIVPMYHLHPEDEPAYHCPNQYYFGRELVTAPHVKRLDADTRLSRQVLWFPEGDWYNFFNGEHIRGGGWRGLYGGLDEIPVFARAGAIIPLGPLVGWGGMGNPLELDVYVFGGSDNRFELYEDDGETTGYLRGEHCLTAFSQSWGGSHSIFEIESVRGDVRHVPAQRRYHLHFRGIENPDRVEATINGMQLAPRMTYHEATETLTCRDIVLNATDGLQVTLASNSGRLLSERDRTAESCRKLLRAFRLNTRTKHEIDQRLSEIIANIDLVGDYWMVLRESQALALAEVVAGKALDRDTTRAT